MENPLGNYSFKWQLQKGSYFTFRRSVFAFGVASGSWQTPCCVYRLCSYKYGWCTAAILESSSLRTTCYARNALHTRAMPTMMKWKGVVVRMATNGMPPDIVKNAPFPSTGVAQQPWWWHQALELLRRLHSWHWQGSPVLAFLQGH